MRDEWFWCLLIFSGSLIACVVVYGENFGTEAMVLALPDTKGYSEIGSALWQCKAPPDGLLALRGYFYPMVATALLAASPYLLWGFQAAAVALGVLCLLRVERIAGGRVWATPLVLLSVSLLLSPANMMTEALSFALASAAVAMFALRPATAWGFLLLVLAGLIKPAYLLAAIVAAPFSLRFDWTSARSLLLAIIVIAPQIVLTYVIDGRAQLSRSGQLNFEQRFYPAVVGTAEFGHFVDYKSSEAAAARKARPAVGEKVEYLLSRPVATVRTWTSTLLHQHLLTRTGFAAADNAAAQLGIAKLFHTASSYLNLIFVVLAIPAVLGVLTFLRQFPVRSWPAALIGPSIIVTAPLVYWQGDRVVYSGLLLLLPFAGLGMRTLSQQK